MWTIFYFKLYMTLLKVFKHSKTSVEVHRTKAKSSKWNGRQMDKFCFKKWPTSPDNFQLVKSFFIWIFLHQFVRCFCPCYFLCVLILSKILGKIFSKICSKNSKIGKMTIFRVIFLVKLRIVYCFSKNLRIIS